MNDAEYTYTAPVLEAELIDSTVFLSWTPAISSHAIIGVYTVYRSVNGAPFASIGEVDPAYDPLEFEDTFFSEGDSLRYYVEAAVEMRHYIGLIDDEAAFAAVFLNRVSGETAITSECELSASMPSAPEPVIPPSGRVK